MTEAIKGDSVDSALELQQHFRSLITGQEEVDEDVLGKLVSLEAVKRYPSRIKCVLLGWHALAHALHGDAAAAALAGDN